MRRTEGFVVAPMSRADIREKADEVRDALGVKSASFPILHVVDVVLPKIWPDFLLEVVAPGEMYARFGPDTHGMTYPDDLHMIVREDVYENAYHNAPQARFTLAHELAHVLLHGGAGMARRVQFNTPIYANSEWQADVFASELLVSWRHISWDANVRSVMKKFNVSARVADIMVKVFSEEGML